MATQRKDWELQQLGIIQWVLKRPILSLKKVNIFLPSHVRLVIVSDNLLTLHEMFISDVLRVLQVSSEQILQFPSNRAAMLSINGHCNSWQIGCKEPLAITGAQLVSPKLEKLQISPSAKRSLWKQICDHENDFFLMRV